VKNQGGSLLAERSVKAPTVMKFEDQHRALDAAITSFWRNHMTLIKNARLERGEK